MSGAAPKAPTYRKSLRFRVSLALGLLTATMALAFGGLHTAFEWLSPHIVFNPLGDHLGRWIDEGDAGDATFVWSQPINQAPSPAALETLVPQLPVGGHIVETPDGAFDVWVEEEDGKRYAVVFDESFMDRQEKTVTGLFIFVIFGAAGLCGLFGFLVGSELSDLILAPLGTLTRRVADMPGSGNGPGDPDTPSLASTFADDEVGRLATAFDEAQARLSKVLEREKVFVADAAHELRNGVAAISSTAEVLIDAETVPSQAQRLQRLQRSCTRLGDFSRILLILAREEEPERLRVPRSVSEILEEVVEERRARAEAKGKQLALHIEQETYSDAPSEVLVMVIGNLVDNALSHARSRVEVRMDADRLKVDDDGPGVPTEIPSVFGRGARGERAPDGGFGLGLSIVQRLCDRYGWQVGLENRSDGGARATVGFA